MFSIVADLADLIALHEIGHACVAAQGHDFVAMDVVALEDAPSRLREAVEQGSTFESFEVNSGAVSRWEVLRNRKTGRGRMVLPGRDAHEIDEYAPDVFAALARSVLDAQGPPHAATLQSWRSRYVMWTLTALLLEVIEDEAQGGAWLKGMRLITRRSEGMTLRTTHPAAATRNDVVLFHLRELLNETGVESRTGDGAIFWQPFKRQHAAIWSKDLLAHHEYLIQDARPEKLSEEASSWLAAFDKGVSGAPWRFDELGPKARLLAMRFLSELRGLAAAIRGNLIPRAALKQAEAEIANRILASAREPAFSQLRHFSHDLSRVAQF